MKLFIPKDMFDNPQLPRLFLCTTGKKIIGQLDAFDVSLDAKWNAYSELSFTINRTYVDLITGETKVHPLFDKTEGLRKVYVENIGYFVIQDPDSTYSDADIKNLSAFSIEYEAGTKYLESFRINTGDVDSKEVLYLETIYGTDYTIDTDNLYKLASSGEYDPYESYYIKSYSDNSYVYEQIQIGDETTYQFHFGNGSDAGIPLYIKSYPNVRFYNPSKPQLSLLHLIFEKIPEWKIGNVDTTLWRKERKFDQERVPVYDFLMNDISDTFKCVVEWDTINSKVNFYEEAEDGINDDNTVQTRFDTDIFISRENLANQINVKYSADNIKTKLKVSGSDDLDIREVNLGKNYIMNLDFFHNSEWMEQDVFEAYDDYLNAVEKYTTQYTDAVQGWVAAYNQWNDLMNAVPAEAGVVLIDDPFEELYCIYSKYSRAATWVDGITYYSDERCTKIANPQPNKDTDFEINNYYVISQNDQEKTLKEKLKIYSVNEDKDANKSDNILLRLKNSDADIATLRLYFDENEDDYMIQKVVVRATSGLTDTPTTYTINQWITRQLTAEKLQLQDYIVSYIGTMGAYFVLAKDESNPANLENYGINLLKEKHDTYTTIFQAQTEGMFSQEKYQCVASDEPPEGDIESGTRWLDTDSDPLQLWIYQGGWVLHEESVSKNDAAKYEDYQRYLDNYQKLQSVQKMLLQKEKEAEYCLDGYMVSTLKIDLSLYDPNNGYCSIITGQSLEGDMERAARAHFGDRFTITKENLDTSLPLYTFTTSFDPLKYIKNVDPFNKNKTYYIKVTLDSGAVIYEPISFDSELEYDNFNDTLYVRKGHIFAVYLKGTTPYVSYLESRGAYQAKMNYISQLTDFENFFTEEQWISISPLVREDEFTDDNFLLTGYESEEERIEICKELVESASKELKTLCQPSLEFSMNISNILAIPEFAPIKDQFSLGNFVRVGIRPDYNKRARLLEVHLKFDDLSDFNCNFGNLITTKSEIDKHAELLSQAMSAGKQVATSAGSWQRAVDKSNRLEEEISKGLQNAALQVGSASGQDIVWDKTGIWGRKLIDGTTDQYEDEQFRIINNKLVFSNDGFRTSKSVMGKFEVDGVEHWGLLAEAMIGGYIEGAVLKGGELSIGGDGGTFKVHSDGSVEILGPDAKTPVYATKDTVDVINQATQYRISLEYNGTTIFAEHGQTCTITCRVFDWDTDITDKLPSDTEFKWMRISNVNDTLWNASHTYRGTNIITITNEDIEKNAQFYCLCTFDETKLS